MDLLNRAVILVLIAGVQLSALESAISAARDGDVHHESSAEAAQHTEYDALGHADEALEESSEHEHGPEHRHGTSADHCTHVHGVALPATLEPWLPSTAGEATSHPLSTPRHHVSQPNHEPPRYD